MHRLLLKSTPPERRLVDNIYEGVKRRVLSGERGTCPVELLVSFLRLSSAQSCGKCTPCRVGVSKIIDILENVLDGRGSFEDLELIKRTASVIADTADCAIGYQSAQLVLQDLDSYRQEFAAHLTQGACLAVSTAVSCRQHCPADVDVPGYIALCAAGRYQDALRLIRKDNPLPVSCALICEHPCEEFCRRGIVDDPINIRALKRTIIEKAGETPPPPSLPATGKRVAVVGGGPGGLSAAYFLSLMGHQVTLYEKRKQLGGMLRYGIPIYRLPARYLDADIKAILATGVEVVLETEIGKDITLGELRERFDSVFITIGAHGARALGIPGEESRGVLSAVELLSQVGDGVQPDFSNKDVMVIGGGNVAMDATRTALRLGAKTVCCAYRRRIDDMTAMPHEVAGAIAEGAEIIPLRAPLRVEANAAGEVEAVILAPQISGEYRSGRPMPRNAALPEERWQCQVVIVAVGQSIDSEHFKESGVPLRWDQLRTTATGAVLELPGVFAGGDCSYGPASAIRAIEAGKVAAANIDTYLGYNHQLELDIAIPTSYHGNKPQWGRATCLEREAAERRQDFDLIEYPLSEEEGEQECSRCLRCDIRGLGALKEGRVAKW
ncbi:MAG: NAD(P)-binding protein [Symbiobacteriaceae bacterium]|nr:NAD(P)-binding protein [Symbiobacteriaceae bacterium]